MNEEAKNSKVKLVELVNPLFQKTLEDLTKVKLPAKVSFNIRKSHKVVAEYAKDFEETKMETLKKYAKLTEAGEFAPDANGRIEFKDQEAANAFSAEIVELANQEVEIPKVSAEDLMNSKGFELEAATWAVLEPILS